MPDSLRNALIGVGLGLLVLFLVVGCQPRQSVVGYTQVSPAGAVVAPAGVAGGTTIINNGSHGGHDSGFGSSFLGSMAGSMFGNALSRPSAVVVAPHAAVSPTYGATGIGSRTVTTTSPINRYGVMPSTGVTPNHERPWSGDNHERPWSGDNHDTESQRLRRKLDAHFSRDSPRSMTLQVAQALQNRGPGLE